MSSKTFPRLVCGILAISSTAIPAYAELGKDPAHVNALASGADAKANPQAKAAVQQFMAGPSVFIQNAGQWTDASVQFALDGSGANVGLTDQGPRFQLFRKTSDLYDPTQPLKKSTPESM